MIATLNSWANESRLLLWALEDEFSTMTPSGYDQAVHGGIGHIAVKNRVILKDLLEAMQWFVYGYTSSHNYSYWGTIHQGLYNRASPVTWQTICEAWIKDDFAGRMPTIAVIDRMRQILWDEPFFVQWAARPERQI